MTEIKPLKSIKDEYNDFYKKLSGFGKSIEDLEQSQQMKIETSFLFEQADLLSI